MKNGRSSDNEDSSGLYMEFVGTAGTLPVPDNLI